MIHQTTLLVMEELGRGGFGGVVRKMNYLDSNPMLFFTDDDRGPLIDMTCSGWLCPDQLSLNFVEPSKDASQSVHN